MCAGMRWDGMCVCVVVPYGNSSFAKDRVSSGLIVHRQYTIQWTC